MRLLGLVMIIAIAAVLRILPHPPNFTPIAAMALFGGALLPRRGLAFAVPLFAMLAADLVIGFHDQMPAVYLAFVLITAMGLWLRKERSVARVAGVSVASSLLFFFITNFAVWAQTTMYEKTLAGLTACFVAALPFLQNSLTGGLLYTGLFFGAWALTERALPQLARQAS
jgi:hypothetical protein